MKPGIMLVREGGLNKTLYFILLCLLAILAAYISKAILITDDLYFKFFGDQLTYERITEIVNLNKKWEWVSYAMIPIFYLVKIFLVGTCLYTGTILSGIEISFRKIFQIALLAEGIFLIPIFLRLAWFLLVEKNYTLTDLQFFYPFSAINLVNPHALEIWWIYPLQVLNIFEVLYMLAIAYGLFLTTEKRYPRLLAITACSYATGLFIWVVSVTFLTVSFSI